MKTYLLSLVKAIKFPLIIAVGLVINSLIFQFPDFFNLTIGAVLILIYDILKHKVGVRLP